MANFLRMVLGVLLLPMCWGVVRAFCDSVMAAAGESGGITAESIALVGGMAAFALCWMAVSHPVKTYVLGHELTHALWCFPQAGGRAEAAGPDGAPRQGLTRGGEEKGREGPSPPNPTLHAPPGRRRRGSSLLQLSFALSVLGSPAVLLLDEPTTGMDPEGATQEIRFDPWVRKISRRRA